MTADEWDAIDDPLAMIVGLKGTAGLGRKRRLAVCGCCRIHLGDQAAKYESWIEVAERTADGDDRPTEREEANRMIRDRASWPEKVRLLLSVATWQEASNANLRHALQTLQHKKRNLTPAVSDLLRDLFSNLLRPVPFDPSWRTETTTGLAEAMYETRTFANMPILADALEEAGCDQPDVLAHCRSETATHYRGCWVVDLVFGKA